MGEFQKTRKFHFIHFTITTFCFIGFAVSFFAFFVELRLEKDPAYEALCDIGENMSCTKVFGSEYGKGFGFLGPILGKDSPFYLPNSIYGMVYYTLFFFLNLMNTEYANLVMVGIGSMGMLMSLYLAYLLIYVLRDLCIVCASTYFINGTLLFMSGYKTICVLNEATKEAQKKKAT